jgi:LysR family transcriptional regulator, carnitine catabolism transcriptional activator
MLPTLRQLEAFIAVCNEGSFHAAAQRINASPSSLSALIRELEANLDASLFDRTTRRVSLTQAGDALREPALRALKDVERGAAQVRAVLARKIGRVTIAAPPLLTAELVVPVARRLRSKYPGVEIRIMDQPSLSIPELVRSGVVDIAFGAFSKSEPECAALPLLKGPLYALLPKNSPLAALRSIPIAQLAQQGLILQDRGSPFRQELDRIFLQHNLEPDVAFEVTHFTTIFSMVENGFGLSIVPPYIQLATRGRSTVVRPVRAAVATSEILMIHDARRALPSSAKAFFDIAKEYLSELQESAGAVRRR